MELLIQMIIIIIKMSLMKNKKTTDITVQNQKEVKKISLSAAKMTNRLSMSFYDQDTLKKQKQIILDTYQNFQTQQQQQKPETKHKSESKYRVQKTKTPTGTFFREQNPHHEPIAYPIQKIKLSNLNTNSNPHPHQNSYKKNDAHPDMKLLIKPRQCSNSSNKSSKSKKGNKILFTYITNRVDSSAKGWATLKQATEGKKNLRKQGKSRGKEREKGAERDRDRSRERDRNFHAKQIE